MDRIANHGNTTILIQSMTEQIGLVRPIQPSQKRGNILRIGCCFYQSYVNNITLTHDADEYAVFSHQFASKFRLKRAPSFKVAFVRNHLSGKEQRLVDRHVIFSALHVLG